MSCMENALIGAINGVRRQSCFSTIARRICNKTFKSFESKNLEGVALVNSAHTKSVNQYIDAQTVSNNVLCALLIKNSFATIP